MKPRNLPHILQVVIADVARKALDQDRAIQKLVTIDGDPMIKLEPREQFAAPLEISVDSEHLVTCFPGRSGMTYEVFSKEIGEIEDSVRGLAEAVIQGRYSERVNDTGKKTKIVAEWFEGDARITPHNNVFRSPRPGAKDWRTVTYAPYLSDSSTI